MRTHTLRPTLVLILACLLAVLFYILGVVVPQANFRGGFLLPILVAFLWGRRRDIYIVTALASTLALIAFWAGGSAGLSSFLVNQLLPLGILWAAAWLLAQRRQILDRQQNLAAEVAARTTELAASERRYRLLAKNAGDLIWTVDMDGSFTYASPAAQRVRGVTGDEEQSASWFDRMPPATAARAAAALQADLAALRAGRPIDGMPRAAPAYRKDGTLMWSETIMSPLYDEDGKPLGLCGTTRDITARKELEEQLRAGEAQLRAALQRVRLATDAAEIGIWNWNFADDSLEWDDRVCDLYAVPPAMRAAGLYNQFWRARVHPDDLAAIDTSLAAVRQVGTDWNSTFRIVLPTGHVRHIYSACIVEQDAAGVALRMVGINRDITDQVLYAQLLQDTNTSLEQQVAQRTAEVQDLYDNAPTGFHTLDPHGCYVRVNQTELNWLGYTREELIGRSFAEFVTPAGQAAFRANFPLFKQRGWARDLEYDLVRKDGTTFPVLVNATAVYDEQGCYVASRGTLYDNTERKRAEQALRSSEETLRLANGEMTRALQLKDEFLAMISHELRTPLTGVLSMSELLEDQIAGPLNDRQLYYVKGIFASGERLLNVLNGILGYTHLLSGKIKLDVAPCDLAYLLDICAASHRSQAAAKGQAISVQVAPPDLTITADATALADVLKRLLDNAVKFTPAGGQIGLDAHPSTVPDADLARSRPPKNSRHLYPLPDPIGEAVEIIVWDTGIGISADQVDHVFHAFTQADARLSRSHEGIGLGLAYVDHMVRLMGGTISVASTPGAGSRFTITLPAQR